MADKSEQLARFKVVYLKVGWNSLHSHARAWAASAKRTLGRWASVVRDVRTKAAAREERFTRIIQRARASCRGQLLIVVRPWRWSRRLVLTIGVLALLAYPVFASVEQHTIHIPLSGRTLAVRNVYGVLVGRIVGTTPSEALAVAEVIVDESAKFGFDPLFVVAVMETESNFDVEAVSRSGAKGLMQVIPSTFRSFSTSSRMLDPVENTRVGVQVLGQLSKSFTKPETLLLAYNAGPGGALQILRGEIDHSAESASYAPKVMSKYGVLLKQHGKDPRQAKKTYIAQGKVVR